MAIGLIFSGQGAQQIGMAKSLYENTTQGKHYFDLANEILGFNLKKACFEGPDELLTQTSYCQPALFVHGYILYSILKERSDLGAIEATFGLSLGELTAYAAAGVFDFEIGLRIVAKRGALMQEACEQTQGAMACLIGGSRAQADALCASVDADIANINCPGQIVIAGEQAKIDAALEEAKEMTFKRVMPLNVAGAYHSRLMEPARKEFEAFLKDITFNKPTIKVLTNVTGGFVEDPEVMKQMLVSQVVSSVLFEDCLKNAVTLGLAQYYECGPGAVLSGLARRTDKSMPVMSLSEFSDLPEAQDNI